MEDWRWQLKNRITTLEELKTYILLTLRRRGREKVRRAAGNGNYALFFFFDR